MISDSSVFGTLNLTKHQSINPTASIFIVLKRESLGLQDSKQVFKHCLVFSLFIRLMYALIKKVYTLTFARTSFYKLSLHKQHSFFYYFKLIFEIN